MSTITISCMVIIVIYHIDEYWHMSTAQYVLQMGMIPQIVWLIEQKCAVTFCLTVYFHANMHTIVQKIW